MGNSSFTDSKNRSAGTAYNEIIKFAVCVNNMDPRRAGRIRAIKNDGEGITSGKVNDPVKAIIKLDKQARENNTYKPWTLDDPYVFAPFLPLHVNVIPRKGEAITAQATFCKIVDDFNIHFVKIFSMSIKIHGLLDYVFNIISNTSTILQNLMFLSYSVEVFNNFFRSW